MHFGTETGGLNSKDGLNFKWSQRRDFTVYHSSGLSGLYQSYYVVKFSL